MTNFEDIQIGDKVIIESRYGRSIGTVDKITKLFFYVGSYKFKKENGFEPGQNWCKTIAKPYNVVEAMEISRVNLNKKIANHIAKNGLDLSYDDAIKLKTMLGI